MYDRHTHHFEQTFFSAHFLTFLPRHLDFMLVFPESRPVCVVIPKGQTLPSGCFALECAQTAPHRTLALTNPVITSTDSSAHTYIRDTHIDIHDPKSLAKGNAARECRERETEKKKNIFFMVELSDNFKLDSNGFCLRFVRVEPGTVKIHTLHTHTMCTTHYTRDDGEGVRDTESGGEIFHWGNT